MRYRHTQVGYFLIAVYGAVMLFAGILYVATDRKPLAMAIVVVMLVVVAQFYVMTVSVNDRLLRVRFGIGVIRKGFLLQDIAACRPVTNPWYYGWGIRYTPRGWLYNVSGFCAVELTLNSRRTVRIGTDDADRLARAINEARDGLLPADRI